MEKLPIELEIITPTKPEASRERRCFIKEIFLHRGRICMVMEMRWASKFIGTFHNGYVQTLPKNKGKSYDKFNRRIHAEEITFGDTWEWMPDIFFFGFDSGHAWNDIHPESKTFEAVKKRTIELCDEMVRKGI